METNTKCIICKGVINDELLKDQFWKASTSTWCNLFWTLSCRHLHFSCDGNESEENKKEKLCCETCFPVVKSFCEMCQERDSFQAKLNEKFQQVGTLMTRCVINTVSHGSNPHVNGDETGKKFRQHFLTEVIQSHSQFPISTSSANQIYKTPGGGTKPVENRTTNPFAEMFSELAANHIIKNTPGFQTWSQIKLPPTSTGTLQNQNQFERFMNTFTSYAPVNPATIVNNNNNNSNGQGAQTVRKTIPIDKAVTDKRCSNDNSHANAPSPCTSITFPPYHNSNDNQSAQHDKSSGTSDKAPHPTAKVPQSNKNQIDQHSSDKGWHERVRNIKWVRN